MLLETFSSLQFYALLSGFRLESSHGNARQREATLGAIWIRNSQHSLLGPSEAASGGGNRTVHFRCLLEFGIGRAFRSKYPQESFEGCPRVLLLYLAVSVPGSSREGPLCEMGSSPSIFEFPCWARRALKVFGRKMPSHVATLPQTMELFIRPGFVCRSEWP